MFELTQILNFPGAKGSIKVSNTFANGSSLAGTATFQNTSISALNLVEGSHQFTRPFDTVTLNIGDDFVQPLASVPLPAGVLLLLSGLGTLANLRGQGRGAWTPAVLAKLQLSGSSEQQKRPFEGPFKKL